MTLRRTTRLLLAGTLATGLLAGCSSDGSDAAAPTTAPATTEAPATTSTAPPVATTTTAGAGATTTAAAPVDGACTTGATEPPPGAATKEIVDVDGDGKPDQGWIFEAESGSVVVGITTAAGGGSTAAFDSASPVRRSMLVTNADDRGPVEIFLDDGRLVQLYAFVDCELSPVTNPEGETYAFGLGFTDVGTGVGCVDTDEGRRLVGLDRDDEASQGDDVAWSRTIVELDGTAARNGPVETGTYTRPADDAAIDLLSAVTCGDLTMDRDGITAPQR